MKRMGWSFKWVSSFRNSFNYDYYVSFSPEEVKGGKGYYNYEETEVPSDREGFSAFYKKKNGETFHTYSTFARGIDILNGAYNFLDMMPKGRDESGLESPQSWVEYHDRYKG